MKQDLAMRKKKYPKFLKSKAGIIIRISMSFIVHCNILEPTEDFPIMNKKQETAYAISLSGVWNWTRCNSCI